MNDHLPSYYEVVASIVAEKPIKGYKSNAYLIFDYQSETDFKFAGIDDATNKMVIGHFDGSEWVVDAETSLSIRFNKDYELENERVLLRPLTLEDVDMLLPFSINEPSLWDYSLIPANGKANLINYIKSALQSRKDVDRDSQTDSSRAIPLEPCSE